MAEETKDQVTEEKKEEKKEETQEQSKELEKPELPKKDFFRKDTMDKFLHESELFDKAQAEKEQSEEKKPKEKAVEKEKTKPEEKKEPIAILKVEGKDVPVYSQKELEEHAQKGIHYTKRSQAASDKEKDLDRREAEVREFESKIEKFSEKLGQPLQTLMKAAEEGKLPVGEKEPEVDKDAEMKVKMKEFMENKYIDEDMKAIFKHQQDEIDALKSKTKETESKSQDAEKAAVLTQQKQQLNEVIVQTREEHPFDDLVDDDGNNLTEDFLGGLVVIQANKDNLRAMSDKNFQPRDIQTIFRDSVINVKKIEDIYRKKFSNSSGEVEPEKLTAKELAAKYPDQIKELVQDGVVDFKKNEDETTVPIAKGRDLEAKVEKEAKPKIKSVKDGLMQAMEDPEIEEGLAELAKSAPSLHK